MSQIINLEADQALLDAAVQHLGDAEKTVQSALDNDISITQDVAQVTLADTDVSNLKTVAIMNKAYNIPASKDGEQIGYGIGFWRVAIDFKVS